MNIRIAYINPPSDTPYPDGFNPILDEFSPDEKLGHCGETEPKKFYAGRPDKCKKCYYQKNTRRIKGYK